jgi:hypothetical protein
VRNKTTLVLLGLGLLLLVAAFALSRCAEDRLGGGQGPTTPLAKTVEFPRDKQRRAAFERQLVERQMRATGQRPPPPPKPADRLTRALSSPGKDGAVVIEVNAIRHAPLVEKFLACEQARKGDGANSLAQLQEDLGVDVTEDVDRVAFDKDVLAVSGFFEKLKLPAELGEGEAVGDAGRIFRVKGDDGKEMVVGKLGNDLLFTGLDEAQVRSAIDRAEGRAPAGPSFPDGVAAGEVYGVVGQALLQDLLGSVQDPAAAQLAQVITESRLQVAVDDAAALSLDLSARSADEGRDLGRALGGIVTAARAKALDAGDNELAGLLEQARVDVGDDGRVAFDFAVPGDDLLRMMGCDADGHPLAAGAPTTVPATPPTK